MDGVMIEIYNTYASMLILHEVRQILRYQISLRQTHQKKNLLTYIVITCNTRQQ